MPLECVEVAAGKRYGAWPCPSMNSNNRVKEDLRMGVAAAPRTGAGGAGMERAGLEPAGVAGRIATREVAGLEGRGTRNSKRRGRTRSIGGLVTLLRSLRAPYAHPETM